MTSKVLASEISRKRSPQADRKTRQVGDQRRRSGPPLAGQCLFCRQTGDYLAFVVEGTKKFAEDMAGVDAAVTALKEAPAFKHLRNFDDLHRGNVNRAYLRFESAQ